MIKRFKLNKAEIEKYLDEKFNRTKINLYDIHNFFDTHLSGFHKFVDKILVGSKAKYTSATGRIVQHDTINKYKNYENDGIWVNVTTNFAGFDKQNTFNEKIKFDTPDCEMILYDLSDEQKAYLKDLLSQVKGKRFDL